MCLCLGLGQCSYGGCLAGISSIARETECAVGPLAMVRLRETIKRCFNSAQSCKPVPELTSVGDLPPKTRLASRGNFLHYNRSLFDFLVNLRIPPYLYPPEFSESRGLRIRENSKSIGIYILQFWRYTTIRIKLQADVSRFWYLVSGIN